MKFILLALIRGYQIFLSPLKALLGTPSTCRFQPTCSQYAIEALKLHGALKGSWLATKRILKCHPWGPCGYDPVPGKNPEKDSESKGGIHKH